MKEERIKEVVREEVRDAIARHVYERHDKFTIKDCPKCKHPVLATEQQGAKIEDSDYRFHGQIFYNYEPNYYQCLTCGSRFIRKEKYELLEG